FSFANERTFLAWIRTALALVAAGVAADVLDLSMDSTAQTGLALALVGLGLVSTLAAWWRWALAERAMRRRGPLPTFTLGMVLTVVLAIAALVVTAVLATG